MSHDDSLAGPYVGVRGGAVIFQAGTGPPLARKVRFATQPVGHCVPNFQPAQALPAPGVVAEAVVVVNPGWRPARRRRRGWLRPPSR